MHVKVNHWAGALLALLSLSACQSRENADLAPAGLTMEDPAFHPSDTYLRMGKVQFHERAYGLAEENFRKAVEVSPRDTEAWLGLAASYDQLRRFDLADNAYEKALALGTRKAIILNNMGYSQLMRGNTAEARRLILKAYEMEPDNPYILNNLSLLGETGRTVQREPT